MAACTDATPALKDLPKVPDTLKTQLEGFNHEQMKHASTQERNVLPSAEGTKVSFLDIVIVIRNFYDRVFLALSLWVPHVADAQSCTI